MKENLLGHPSTLREATFPLRVIWKSAAGSVIKEIQKEVSRQAVRKVARKTNTYLSGKGGPRLIRDIITGLELGN